MILPLPGSQAFHFEASTVTLRDGSKMFEFAFLLMIKLIDTVFQENELAFYDLALKCLDNHYVFPKTATDTDSRAILHRYALLQTDDSVTATTKQFVLNMLEETSSREEPIRFVNPLRPETFVEFLETIPFSI
ncbi:MAG: hypothetical protein JSR76_08470 [Verrucomicrobia bacterium]|nr:hypothetical protein [Verrucomicrobiota bacterium]